MIAALHRANQLGYPVMIVGAGLPKIYKMLSDEKMILVSHIRNHTDEFFELLDMGFFFGQDMNDVRKWIRRYKELSSGVKKKNNLNIGNVNKKSRIYVI